jgi:tRNA pseudouridine38-40 synthase
MPRYRLIVEYDGAGFVGWQRQKNGLAVQEVLETAVRHFSGERVVVHGAGRTDSGVHALGQAAHLDLARDYDPLEILGALNHHMKPAPVAVLSVERTADNFDARRSARSRAYLYRIVNRRAPLGLDRGRAWHVGPDLDDAAMHEAARILLGRHDFTTFRDSLCQAKSAIKTLDRLDVVRQGDEIRVTAEARSFLHHQVRNMVGTLKLVGAGKWRGADVSAALAARDRREGGPTAPADGLYLVRVVY